MVHDDLIHFLKLTGKNLILPKDPVKRKSWAGTHFNLIWDDYTRSQNSGKLNIS
jgi:hypothetical protein